MDSISLAVDTFYMVLFLFTSAFSWRILHALRGGEINRSWWAICTGMIMFFLGSVVQFILDLLGLYSPLTAQAFYVPAAALFLLGVYLQYQFWRIR